ncbi:hypothetical protein SF12_21515 [Streptomyces sp. MBRL 601]|nr:hypothetical protein SF12_21515 [Streptomyces sp. MBRL 601]
METHVWDLATGERTARLETHGTEPRFSSGGRFLVGWSPDDGTVEIWPADRNANQPLAGISTADTDATSVDLALDERTEVLRHIPYGSERLYETDVAGMVEHATSTSRPADGGAAAGKYGVALSPDGRTGLVREGEENPTLRLVGLADGKAIGEPVTQAPPSARSSNTSPPSATAARCSPTPTGRAAGVRSCGARSPCATWRRTGNCSASR